ncbi:rhamnosidase, partial [Schumannella luteola]
MTHRQSPPRRRVPVAPTRTITALLVTASLALTSLGGAAAASAEPAAPAVALERLQVEHSTEPIGVDLAHPRLSWVIAAPSARDVVQQSYRVVVDGPSGVAWDSGVVASSASTEIAYAGAALDAATRYDWSVEVVTSAGSARGESTFRTGLHDDADWGGADWIGNPRTPKSDRVTVDGANWIWTPEAAGNPPAEDRAFRRTLTSPNGRDAV